MDKETDVIFISRVLTQVILKSDGITITSYL